MCAFGRLCVKSRVGTEAQELAMEDKVTSVTCVSCVST